MVTTSLAVVSELTNTVLYTLSGLRHPKYTRTRPQLLEEVGRIEGSRSPDAKSWSDVVADAAVVVSERAFDCSLFFLCFTLTSFCKEP